MTAVPLAAPAPLRDRSRDRTVVRAWLYAVALLIVAMVLVGGATRLTDSGLSITEWKPIHGVIPPLSDAEWQEEFAKYQQIPEYQEINRGMTLAEFKGIFWWEWAHRLLGRLIGAAVLIPFVVLWLTGRIERPLVPRIVGLFILGGLQGALGWWMVASGLSQRTDVSQYRLAAHLTLASAILAFTLWIARGLAPLPAHFRPAAAPVRRFAGAMVALALLQIYAGGLVAGLDAGFVYNTWPAIDGGLVPPLLFPEGLRSAFEDPLTVQFLHRTIAYILLAAALLHAALAVRAAPFSPHANRAVLLALLVLCQAGIGVATLLAAVPLPLALLHQLGAMLVLSWSVVHLRATTPPLPAA